MKRLNIVLHVTYINSLKKKKRQITDNEEFDPGSG